MSLPVEVTVLQCNYRLLWQKKGKSGILHVTKIPDFIFLPQSLHSNLQKITCIILRNLFGLYLSHQSCATGTLLLRKKIYPRKYSLNLRQLIFFMLQNCVIKKINFPLAVRGSDGDADRTWHFCCLAALNQGIPLWRPISLCLLDRKCTQRYTLFCYLQIFFCNFLKN